MGCALSKPKKRAVDQFDSGHPMDDFSPVARRAEKSRQLNRDIEIFYPPPEDHTSLPGYSEFADAVTYILETLYEASRYQISDTAPKGAFNVMRDRSVQVWLDSNNKLRPATKDAIIMWATLLLSLAKAHHCDMEILFTGYPNKESTKLSDAKRPKLNALEDLWNTENWDDAVKMIEESEELKDPDLGLDRWIQEMDHQNSTTMETTAVRTDDEKHNMLLAKVRDLKSLYWYGWNQEQITAEELQKLYKDSLAAAKKQPKNLNNIRFTIEREMALQERLRQDREAHPTTVLMLVGSPLYKKEIEAIKEYQKKVKGGGSEFAIETLLFCDYLDHDSRRYHAILDDNATGDNDVYDVTEISEKAFLARFPSPKLWYKIMNSHARSVDNMKFRNESEKYGTSLFATGGNLPLVPSYDLIQSHLDL